MSKNRHSKAPIANPVIPPIAYEKSAKLLALADLLDKNTLAISTASKSLNAPSPKESTPQKDIRLSDGIVEVSRHLVSKPSAQRRLFVVFTRRAGGGALHVNNYREVPDNDDRNRMVLVPGAFRAGNVDKELYAKALSLVSPTPYRPEDLPRPTSTQREAQERPTTVVARPQQPPEPSDQRSHNERFRALMAKIERMSREMEELEDM